MTTRTLPSTASLLDRLPAAERTALLDRATPRKFKPGEVLLREGSHGASMIVIDEGDVEVRRGDRVLATLGPGATVGEMALLDPGPRSATVRARTAGSLWEVERVALQAMLAAGDPAAIKALQVLTATVCARLGEVNRMVQEAVVKPSKEAGVWGRLWKSVAGVGKS